MNQLVLFEGPCDAATASAARREIREAQALLEIASRVVEDLELAVTELVTNAVRNGARRIDVRLQVVPATLELRVTDDAPGVPVARRPRAEDAAGRGLQIIATIATDWGWAPAGVSKTVWARFAR